MKKVFIGLVVVAVLVIGLIKMNSTAIAPESIDTVVKAADGASMRVAPAGSFTGFADDFNTHGWLGIPFAQAPVGVLRWRAPQALTGLATPMIATQYHSPCVQYANPLAGVAGDDGSIVGSEDCLSLNIWAPAVAAKDVPTGDKKLPVMVWIHGGGNTIGSTNTYQGNHLAGDQNVVYVGLNYRLGVFGWLSHDSIRNTSVHPADGSGNYGLLDMIAGLKWVQENIAAFGGDPDNVTIFGESAGGRNAYALVASPLAKGLFHKAIMQSGSAATTPLFRAENYSDAEEPGMALSSNELINAVLVKTDRADDRDDAIELMEQMGNAETIGFMRDRSVEEIFSAIEDPGGFGMYSSPQNVRDGYVLPTQSLLKLFNNKNAYNSMPMILGTNRDEAKMFMSQDPKFVSNWFGVIPHIKDEKVYNHYAAYSADQWKALAVDEPAAVLSETQGDIYAYRFDWDEGPKTFLVDFATLLGAGHGLEIAYVFGDFEGGIYIPFLITEENEPGRLALSDSMMNYWGEFARSGSPATGQDKKQVEWKPWSNAGEKTIIFDTKADGGIRMTSDMLTAASIKQRMVGDSMIADQESYCELYASLFLASFQIDDFWSDEEYNTLGAGGCAKYPPYDFASRK